MRGKKNGLEVDGLTRTTRPLHFEDLSGEDFERLCLWLLRREGFEDVQHWGALGADGGRDLIAARQGWHYAFQCKNERRFGPSKAEAAVSKVLKLTADERPDELVLLVATDVSAQTRRRAAQIAAPMPCTVRARSELDEQVKRHPELVAEFFGITATALSDAFVGPRGRLPHQLRVRDTSRFWKTSGIEVSMGADGLDVKVESLASLIAGGVAFDTPVTAAGGSEPSRSGTVFELFESFKSLGESKYVRSIPYLTYFNGSVRGLSVGAPVEFRGIKVGSVTDVAIEFNEETLDARIPVIIEIEPERVSTQVGDNKKEYEILDVLVQRGLRAQLQTGSLLTGQLFVELEIFPKLSQKALIMTGKYPEIPTVPSTMDELQSTVSDVMADIQKLPLDKIAQELLGTMKGANRLVNSPELHKFVTKVSTVLDEVQTLTRDVDQAVVGVADPDSPAMVNLSSSLEELSAAARSIRELADYLETPP